MNLHTPVKNKKIRLSVVIPCFNEERTLKKCIEKVLAISDESLEVEIIIVDDCSSDGSYAIARDLERQYSNILVLHHEQNQGKGAALRNGFQKVTGDFVAVQDADLEYDPMDLKRLIVPLVNNEADVVLGSRFLAYGPHRVLYFWHYLGNRFLTFCSNMFTDLNLTDMETCYKVFRRDIIQRIQIKENRFGFEPEIVAKVAQMRLRIYEMGISYHGRTYAEGKKIGVKDGFRALYCIFRYNAHRAPLPIQFIVYMLIGGFAAVVNLFVFLQMYYAGFSVGISAPFAFFAAAFINYLMCIFILFRHTAKWKTATEILLYILVVALVAVLDLVVTKILLEMGASPGISKILATGIGLIFNFSGRRFFIFPEPSVGPWRSQEDFTYDK